MHTWLLLLEALIAELLRSGTLFRASQFLSEELPIRLAHRVQELADLPDGLNEMPYRSRKFKIGTPSHSRYEAMAPIESRDAL